MPTRRYLRRFLVGWWIAALLSLSVSAWLWLRTDRLEDTSLNLTSAMLDLERAIGYVGLIHHFKNAVLRPDEPQYHADAIASHRRAVDALDRIEQAALAASIATDLTVLRDTLRAYRANLDIARDGHGRGLTIPEVDALVRIPDQIASQQIAASHAGIRAVIADRHRALQTAQTASLLILLCLIAGGTNAFVRVRRMVGKREQAFRDTQLEQERKHTHKLEHLVDQLKTTNRQQAEFAYSVSHDLKSPTNTARMLIGELQGEVKGTLDNSAQELVDDLENVLNRMGSLIEDVLDYTRSLGGDTIGQAVALDAIIDDVLSDLRADLAESGAEICRNPLPTVPGHPVQIRQLFQNLISNALKFREPGRIPRVEIGATPAPDCGEVAVFVRDNGIGIAPENYDKVFGLFGRLHTRDDYDGTGLGLPISRRIAQAHGGDITIDSAPGEGACFTVRLAAC
ncbi:hypothetical protein KUV73_09235 [Mameliella alba]|nr:hypothetical protein [Mameliella alba]MBY6169527.1 hypothetical protein [Mameliella alba]MBY6174546.1 hypothetical protein [Mameliella alba]